MLFIAVATLFVVVPTIHSQWCGGWATMTSGQKAIIYSPNYPNPYPSNSKCEWVIEIPTASTITIECSYFSVVSTSNCKYDYLAVSSKGLSSYIPYQKFCSTGSVKYTIEAQTFRAMFKSSYFSSYRPNRYYRGFSCEVTFTEDGSVSTTTESLPTDTSNTDATTPIEGGFTETSDTTASTNSETTSETCNCGIKNAARIVGGEAATMHEYPWQVMLRTRSGSHYCGGTLISPNYVLTASHCVDDSTTNEMYVSLGDHQKSTSSETDETIHSKVAQIIMHEGYDSNTIDNDIALLRLEEPVTFTDAISPACLPFGMESTDISDQTGTVTGWGTTTEGGSTSETLLEVDLPLLTTSQCKRYYGRQVTDNMICTYEPGKDSCQGDSGGPLVMDEDGRNYLMGVVSWGSGCAQTNAPGVYSKVTNYLDWIQENTEGETFCGA